jgi:Holliday junction resolvase RusA-like endonuclease
MLTAARDFSTAEERAPDLRVWLPGTVKGKGRPRAFVKRGMDGKPFAAMYPDVDTQSYEAQLKFAAEKALKAAGFVRPLDEPLRCRVTAIFIQPSSWSAKKKLITYDHDVKPDADNIMKLVGDSFNRIVWVDDCRVSDWHIRKIYDLNEGLMIEVWRIGGGLL